jgi:hypothetical protein
MDLIKKHYEKVLLGVVLLGLAVAVGFLPFKIASDKAALQDKTSHVIAPQPKPLPGLNLTAAETALKRVTISESLDFGTVHRLLNPMPWQKAADGHLIPFDASHIGPKAVQVTKITPLYLVLTLDSVQVLDSGPRYVIGIKREAALDPAKREKKEIAASVGAKNEAFQLLDVKGPTNDPTSVILKVPEASEPVVVLKDQGLKRVDGYMADLKYAPENKTWTGKRVGQPGALSFGGEDYNVVAINQDEVVLSAKSNQKKWTIKYSPSP